MKTRKIVYLVISILGGSLFVILLLLLYSSSVVQAGQSPNDLTLVESSSSVIRANNVITIGVAADLSGGVASLGWVEANAVQLAISQTNAAGGINIGGITYTVVLTSVDSPCGDPTQAITAANMLIAAGAVAVVGHTCSGLCIAAQPVYAAAGVAMISPSATFPDVTQQGYTTTFRTITHDGTPPALLGNFFQNWLGLTSAAIVESPEWMMPGDYFSNTFTSSGGTITSRRVVTDTSYFTSTLLAIQAEHPDVIAYLSASGDATEAGKFSLTAYGLGMTDTVIGTTSWWNDEGWLSVYTDTAGTEAAEGDHVVMEFRRMQDMPGWDTFLSDYLAAGFAHEPTDPMIFGAYAYDAAMIIFAAIDRADSTSPADIRDQIAVTKDHPGVVGVYAGFDEHGDVIPQLAWLEAFRNGGWDILNPTRLYLPAVLKDPIP